MQTSSEKLGYKRLETDAEFRVRTLAGLGEAGRYWVCDLSRATGDYLDTLVWDLWKKQRRIIEVFP